MKSAFYQQLPVLSESTIVRGGTRVLLLPQSAENLTNIYRGGWAPPLPLCPCLEQPEEDAEKGHHQVHQAKTRWEADALSNKWKDHN